MPDSPRIMDAYIRVSRRMGREGESYISPSVQRDAIQKWATYKNVQIGMWHQDEDWSGGTHQRPGLETAINRALTNQTTGIISWKIDRFSRQTEGGLRDLRRLEAANARLAFVVEDIDTATTYGRMVYTILLAVSEAFLENIKASWIIAKQRAVARGAYVSRTPWGYQRNPDSTLAPHPQRATIVTEAFRLAASDSLHAAHTYLQHAAPERRWTTTKVRRLLSQRSYLGETRHGTTVQPDTHIPLTSRPVWEAAQTTPRKRAPSDTFPLSGLLTCGSCNSPMIGSRGGKGQRTYRCSASLTTTHRERCQQGPVITAALVEKYVQDAARETLHGIRVTVSEPQTDMLTILERALNDAEAELDAFAADLNLRRALGERYHQHLQARADAVAQAQAQYREHAGRAQRELGLNTEELLSTDDPQLLIAGLRSIFASIIVRRGRGLAVKDRVTLVPLVPVHVNDPAGKTGSENA